VAMQASEMHEPRKNRIAVPPGISGARAQAPFCLIRFRRGCFPEE
jgi:hypothetical protein